jgi:hypothetical protein
MEGRMIANLPPRNELWVAVQEAHDYLDRWVNDPSSRQHPQFGTIVFNVYDWGQRKGDGCVVCLGGLYYLHKAYKLLADDHDTWNSPVPPILRFLDHLRYPDDNADEIEEWLGVTITYGTLYLSQEQGGEYVEWDNSDPEHILDFLGWLLDKGWTEGVYVP